MQAGLSRKLYALCRVARRVPRLMLAGQVYEDHMQQQEQEWPGSECKARQRAAVPLTCSSFLHAQANMSSYTHTASSSYSRQQKVLI